MTWPRLKHMAPAYTTGPILSWLRGFYNSAFSSWRILLNSTFLKVLKGKPQSFWLNEVKRRRLEYFLSDFKHFSWTVEVEKYKKTIQSWNLSDAESYKEAIFCLSKHFKKESSLVYNQKMFWELSVFGHNIGKIDKIVIDRYNYSDGLGLSLETIDKIYLNCPTIFFNPVSLNWFLLKWSRF